MRKNGTQNHVGESIYEVNFHKERQMDAAMNSLSQDASLSLFSAAEITAPSQIKRLIKSEEPEHKSYC